MIPAAVATTRSGVKVGKYVHDWELSARLVHVNDSGGSGRNSNVAAPTAISAPDAASSPRTTRRRRMGSD